MLYQELEKLADNKSEIKIGMSGSGWIARGFLRQVSLVKGMRVSLLVDENLEKVIDAFMESGIERKMIKTTDNSAEASDWIASGGFVSSENYEMLGKVETIDIVTDATPSPLSGIKAAYYGILGGKDVILINIEADVTAGRILKKMANDNGVLYSVSSGDEPGCLIDLWDFVSSLGYTPVVIGKGKNSPLNPSANPDTVVESARKSKKDPFQVASYVDGTKTMFEMACAANATGCKPMQRGMIGPKATLKNISEIFALKEDGGITTSIKSVDFVQGQEMAGGVFVTVKIDDKKIREDLEYLKVGKGKYYTFFRPYHLWFLEAPISFAKAFLYRKPTLVSMDKPVAEVLTFAKKNLKPGETLDTFGGYTFYGMIDTYENYVKEDALPVGLAPGAIIKKEILKGHVIKWEDVELDEKRLDVILRRKQEKIDRESLRF